MKPHIVFMIYSNHIQKRFKDLKVVETPNLIQDTFKSAKKENHNDEEP